MSILPADRCELAHTYLPTCKQIISQTNLFVKALKNQGERDVSMKQIQIDAVRKLREDKLEKAKLDCPASECKYPEFFKRRAKDEDYT